MTTKQFRWLIVIIFFCTLFATVAIPTFVNQGYSIKTPFSGKYTYAWVAVTYFGGITDTINVKLQNEPDEETLFLNTKGCLVKERGLTVESVKCGVREFRILATKTDN